MQISKWGNSLAVRLPKHLIKELDLKEGDNIELRKEPDNTYLISRVRTTEEVLRALRQFRGKLNRQDRLSRELSNER